MRHEEARRRLRYGPDAAAEAHLAECLTCFEAIEKDDSLLLALRRAKAAPVPVPAGLADSAIRRWTFRRRLPWLAGAGGLAAASLASAAIIWAFGAAFSEPQSVAQSALGAVLAPVAALLTAFTDLLRARFLDPAWLTALVVIALAGGAGTWLLDREARPGELVGTA